MLKFLLKDGWEFKEHNPEKAVAEEFADSSGWHPANIPGTVHQDLLAAGIIPDPFYGLNEREVQWVGERDWLYRCTFDLPDGFNSQDAVELCFDGLDTFATVWLNGARVATSDNMFVPLRLEIGSHLQPEANTLQLLFDSAFRRGEELEAAYGRLLNWNGAPSRLYVRKAQYHYGWDWGPVLITAGVWREVRLEAFEARLGEIDCPVELSADLGQATIAVEVSVEASRFNPGLEIELTLVGPDNSTVLTRRSPVIERTASATLAVDQPALWWPNGYGGQPLFTLNVTLKKAGRELDHQAKRLGLRQLRLVQEPLENAPGTTFLFEVNHTPIFCSGANWIPSDSFTPRITPARYLQHLELAAHANMVMVRVWGGGIYEDTAFYDSCDELGLLVWQDFMFACGIYPAHESFQDNVRTEAEAAVKQLRHHACLALWCGNNEDYAIAESQQLYDPAFEGDFTTSKFPGRHLYERLLPEVCTRLDPGRTYWPGSPYGGKSSADPVIGDRHTWDVWHGNMADYHDYPRYAGRFVSEFGMESMPSMTAIRAFAPESELYPFSRTLEFHNRSEGGYRRLAVYLSDNLPLVSTLETYQYATQFIQAEAMTFALRGWRRKWGGPGRYEVAGALVWQLNDCWPVTSWALIDYDLTPKPAYYALRREMAPVAVGLWDDRQGHASFWGVNNHDTVLEAELCLSFYTLDGQRISQERRAVVLHPNQATEWGELPYRAEDELVVSAVLSNESGVLARTVLWPEPFKYLKLADPGLQLLSLPDNRLQIQAQRPVKGVVLTADGPVDFSDNFLDLLPGEPQIISVGGPEDRKVSVQSLDSLYTGLQIKVSVVR